MLSKRKAQAHYVRSSQTVLLTTAPSVINLLKSPGGGYAYTWYRVENGRCWATARAAIRRTTRCQKNYSD